MKRTVLASARFLAVFAGLALVSSACSTSRVSQYAPIPNLAPSAGQAAAEAPAKASNDFALETPRPPPRPSTYPNINKVPERVKGKLLTAEEKAKVIAELEALAQAQAAPVAATSQAAKAACDNQVAQTLDPEKSIRKEGDGQQC